MIEVKVQSVMFDPLGMSPVVVLKDVGGDRILPIWIGAPEAAAIRTRLKGESHPRPMTHDLLAAVLRGLGGRLDRVTITGVKEGTYFAEMIVERAGKVFSIDGRPSDCIAMALRGKARIYAEEALLRTFSGTKDDGEESDQPDDDEARMRGAELEDHLRGMRPEDLGRFER